jgi:anti-sigma B factor antagonist
MTQAEQFRSGEFEVSVHRQGETVVLHVSGELDTITTPTLANHLDNALMQGPTVVIVDLAAVDFMSSSGLNLLVNVHRLLEKTPVSMRIVADGPATARVMTVTGVDEILDLYPTMTAALTGLRPETD